MNKLIVVFAGVLLLAAPCGVSAQVIISEIMYDLETGADSGREWIEVFNAGESTVHLTDWKVLEGNTNHAITASSGGEDLSPGAYAIIADNPAKFLLDWPGYSGFLFDTVFSGGLSNTGESIGIRTPAPDLLESDTVTYDNTKGAAGDGKTLQRDVSTGTAFSQGAPTPGSGALAQIPGLGTPPSGGGSAPADPKPKKEDSRSSAPVSSYVAPPEPALYAYAGRNRDVIAGADVTFKGQGYDKKGLLISDANKTRFVWAFGDGTTAEGQTVQHHYSQPGRYAVVLDIANAENAASHQIIVNAHPVSITVSVKDGAIVLANTSGRDLDLSKWILKSGEKSFILPEHSVLLSEAAVPFAGETTGLPAGDDAALAYPNGVIAAKMGDVSAAAPATVLPPADTLPEFPASLSMEKHVKPRVATEKTVRIPAAETQGAAAGAATSGSNVLWYAGALGFGLAGASGAYALRRAGKKEWQIIEERSNTE